MTICTGRAPRGDGRALLSQFDADLSGREVPHDKPDPALFLFAAEALSVASAQCLVIEDAPAAFMRRITPRWAALGIARLGDEALLHDAGADLLSAQGAQNEPDLASPCGQEPPGGPGKGRGRGWPARATA